MDALEYGRIVHAEMSALSDAARLGISVQDATLYCTTFPCHMCANVASGIAKVVFLEPYPKSLTSDLHLDAVKIEGMSPGAYGKFPAMEFIPFFGITPRRYRNIWSAGAIVTLLVGGIGAGLEAEGASTVVGLGWGGILFSFLTIVLRAVAMGAKGKVPGALLMVSAICGAILGGTLVAIFMVLAFIGGLLATIGTKKPAIAAV